MGKRPVCPELFYAHQGRFSICAGDLLKGDPCHLTDDETDSINVVLRDYGDMEPYALRELSHKEAPWKDARNGLPEGEKCRNVIRKESMGEYYGSL